MAIIVDNEYRKITDISYSFESNNSNITMKLYASKEDRDKEKKYLDYINKIKSNIANYIIQEENNLKELEEKTKAEMKLCKITIEKYLEEHSEIIQKANNFENIRKEWWYIRDTLPYYNLDYSKLKYKELWLGFGLTENMCIQINIIGQINQTLTIKTLELNELYNEVKSYYIGKVEDC